ncbi:hypothetical protein N9043_00255 [bacterium]|nr:hypothetical protein [bacterium]
MNKVYGLYLRGDHVGSFLQVLYLEKNDAENALELINKWLYEAGYYYGEDELTDLLRERHMVKFPVPDCDGWGDSYFIKEIPVI